MITAYLESRTYRKELLRANPDTLFVFGDNLMRIGKGGQAIIRDEPNAFGVATKVSPGHNHSDYFYDNSNVFRITINDDLLRLQQEAVVGNYTKIAFPAAGLGTGLSAMPERCPRLFKYMNDLIADKFNIIY